MSRPRKDVMDAYQEYKVAYEKRAATRAKRGLSMQTKMSTFKEFNKDYQMLPGSNISTREFIRDQVNTESSAYSTKQSRALKKAYENLTGYKVKGHLSDERMNELNEELNNLYYKSIADGMSRAAAAALISSIFGS